MKENTKIKNSNPEIVELDFTGLDKEDGSESKFKSKYEVLKLKAREVGPLLGRYGLKLGDFNEFIGSLSFDDYLKILKNTMRDGVFITEDNYDEFFENDVAEAFAVIYGSLFTHLKYSQKKSSGIKVNSTPAKISD